jgi:carbonic anhydrase
VLDKGYDPNDEIKFNFMEALRLGGILPADKFVGTDRL